MYSISGSMHKERKKYLHQGTKQWLEIEVKEDVLPI
jgi:hypothetical protein